MDIRQLSRVISEVFVIKTWGVKKPYAAPSPALAVQVYGHRFIDKKVDGTVYHVRALLDKFAPHMPEGQRHTLVLEILQELAQDSRLAGPPTTKSNLPKVLQKYVG